ncbi:MAG: hypothetical protein Q9169_006835 [Polycauliona sp. 2 TL-2023]
MRNQFKRALLAAGLSSNIGALATVTLTSRVAVCYPSDAPGGKPGEIQSVSSSYGFYTLAGCYAAPPSGYLLDGKTSVSVGMTLASCASYCTGSTFFALQNGNQCLCGSKAPTTPLVGSGKCNTGCSGNPSEHCGTSNTCIVYTSSPPPPPGGSVSVTTYTTTGTNGIASTVTSSTTLPAPPPGSVSVTTFTTTGMNGIASTVTSSTTLPAPPPASVSVTSFVTTGTNGIVSTITSSSTLPPPPPASVSTTTYVTTRPDGIVSTVTSQTSVPRSVSISTFTTTGTNGIVSTGTTSTTVPALPPPPTSVVVVSSTNSQGSVIVSSSTSTAPAAYYSQACGGRYSDNLGQLWCLQCQTAYFYNDLTTVTVGSFEECLESCDTYVPSPNVARGASCIAITWGPRTVGGECYRKFNVTDSRLDRRQDSAYKCDQAILPPAASSLINTNTGNVVSTGGSTPATSNPNVPATSNPNIPATSRSTTPATSAGNVPGTSNPTVPATTPPVSNPGVPATLISSSTTATSVNLVVAYQPCPSSNGQQFINSQGNVYDISCGCDYQYSDLSGSAHVDYFSDCILACDNYVPDPNVARGAPCIGVSWGRPDRNPGGNCYLKYRIESIRCGNPDFCAAVKHTYQITSGVLSTSRPGDVTYPTSAATPIATSSQPPVVVPTSSTSQPPVVIPSSSASQPPVAVPSSSTSRLSVTSIPPPVLPATSTQSTPNPTNTFAPPMISQTFSCPTQNGSTYTDAWGQMWETRCGLNIRGTNAKAVHADTWEKCLQFCDILGGVTGVTYPGGGGPNTNALSVNCYPYSVFTEFTGGAVPTLCAARPLNGSTGNFFNTVPLCPNLNNEAYTDAYSRTYQIRCDQIIGGSDLAGTVTKSLNGCLNYCSTYNTCTGVVYTDYTDGTRDNNCLPRTGAGVSTLTVSLGTKCAQLLTL